MVSHCESVSNVVNSTFYLRKIVFQVVVVVVVMAESREQDFIQGALIISCTDLAPKNLISSKFTFYLIPEFIY